MCRSLKFVLGYYDIWRTVTFYHSIGLYYILKRTRPVPSPRLGSLVVMALDLQLEVVMRCEFDQNRLSGFGAVGGRNLFFAIDLAKSVRKRLNQWEKVTFNVQHQCRF